MTIIKHELRQGFVSFAIWTGSITFLIMICLFLFPEMKGEMDAVGDMFSSMGSFTAAFGMDRLNFGTLIGFYSVECGNVLGLGGAFFASLIGISALSKEEKEHTAEFLLTHPVSRIRVVTEKLIAIIIQVTAMNIILLAASLISMTIIGEDIPLKEILLIHLAYFLMQMEMASLCFGISSFLKRGSLGIGMGLATIMYFLSLISNMTDQAAFLKYITPFGYCEAADIVNSGKLDVPLVTIGLLSALIFIFISYIEYGKKDIQ